VNEFIITYFKVELNCTPSILYFRSTSLGLRTWQTSSRWQQREYDEAKENIWRNSSERENCILGRIIK